VSRLGDATSRLESALERLEAAVAERTGRSGADRDALQATIDRVRQENATLKQSVASSTTRLDIAIGRLKSMVGD